MTSARPILIVDDDIDHAVILRTVLASVAPGSQTDTCTDPDRMPDVLLQALPGAVVFVDRMLRGVESLPDIEEVTRRRSDLHVVVLSSALSAEDEARARSVGAADAVEKPGTLAQWRALLERVLDEAGGADSGTSVRAG